MITDSQMVISVSHNVITDSHKLITHCFPRMAYITDGETSHCTLDFSAWEN